MPTYHYPSYHKKITNLSPMHLNESTRLRERRERLPELMVEEERKKKVLKPPNGRGRPEEGFPAGNLGGSGGRARGGECGGRGWRR